MKNIENSYCIDQLESDCEEIQIQNYSDLRITEKSKTVDQSDSDCEEIQSDNNSDLKTIENSAMTNQNQIVKKFKFKITNLSMKATPMFFLVRNAIKTFPKIEN